uniref:Structural protein n=1 Tax=Motacilla cinerea parvoviridae sp. TaxID=2794518 RepID=A0A8A4XEA0_9VIRU|nr:MAG: structural protein [Motacilla cinerea parvoviridae sp.]
MIWFPMINPQYHMLNTPLIELMDFEKSPEWFGITTEGTDKVTGMWSLESKKKIKRFVGLRAKTYAIEFEDGTSTLKNKGIVSTAKEDNERRPLQFEDYVKCLFEDKDIYVEQMLIRSKLHSISTITQRKLALSANDEKRATLADKITTLPFGYNGELFADNATTLPSIDLL